MTDSLRDTILAIITNGTDTYEHPSEYIHLLDIRNRLAELDGINPARSEVDAALLDLHLSGDAYLMIEEGFRFLALHPEYTEAGVRVGGEVRHLITISR
jgi:hypothetical protein